MVLCAIRFLYHLLSFFRIYLHIYPIYTFTLYHTTGKFLFRGGAIYYMFIYLQLLHTYNLYVFHHISFDTAENKNASFLFVRYKKKHIYTYACIYIGIYKRERFNYPHTDGLPLFFIL